jgi:cysteine desulfurase / selenocysteine lyase
MNGSIRYLDWAATSAIRPLAVRQAMADYLEGIGATPGRGGHRLAVEAGRVALHCRQAIARILNIPGDTGRIAFMFNATHAINTAMCGVLRKGDAVVVTDFDHNAVLRCAWKLAAERGIEVRLVPGRRDGTLDNASLERALDGARLFTINAASNVLGTTLDVAALCAEARASGVMTLVDTAQVAGEIPCDVQAWGADLVCVTGHKALLGPQGTGALWVREGVDVEPLLVGGTGGNSRSREMPREYPDHLEAGTLNAPGLAGLLAGIEFVLDEGVDVIRRHLSRLKVRAYDSISAIPGVRVLSPRAPDGAPLVTLIAESVDAGTLAARLDREFGILTRSGLHCAPETHRLMGTAETGALRLSFGWASHVDDVDAAAEAITAIVRTSTVEVGHVARSPAGADAS